MSLAIDDLARIRLALLIAAACALAGARSRAQAAPERVQIHVLAGQSNAVGYGCSTVDLPAALQLPQDQVGFIYEVGPEGAEVDPTLLVSSGGQVIALGPQLDASGLTFGGPISGFGPEVELGRYLAEGTDDQVAIVKCAVNATTLAYDWNAAVAGGLYDRLKALVAAAAQHYAALGMRPHVEGFYWMQGEWDALGYPAAAAYQVNLTALIAAARVDFRNPLLPVVVGRLHDELDQAAGGVFMFAPLVRAAQEAVAASVHGVHLIDTDDLGVSIDQVHFLPGAQLALGHRFAGALTAVKTYGQSAGGANTIELAGAGFVLGQPLHLALSSVPGGFVEGYAAAAPSHLPAMGGTVLIDPAWTLPIPFTAQAVGGEASIDLLLPGAPGLAGATLYLQSFAPDVSQPFGVAFSNGLAVTLSP